MDSYLTWSQFHILALTRHFISLASLHFDGRIWGRGLLNFTDEGLEHFLELSFGHIDGLVCLRHLTVRIECIGPSAQADNGLISFIRSGNIFAQANCGTYQYYEYT